MKLQFLRSDDKTWLNSVQRKPYCSQIVCHAVTVLQAPGHLIGFQMVALPYKSRLKDVSSLSKKGWILIGRDQWKVCRVCVISSRFWNSTTNRIQTKCVYLPIALTTGTALQGMNSTEFWKPPLQHPQLHIERRASNFFYWLKSIGGPFGSGSTSCIQNILL